MAFKKQSKIGKKFPKATTKTALGKEGFPNTEAPLKAKRAGQPNFAKNPAGAFRGTPKPSKRPTGRKR